MSLRSLVVNTTNKLEPINGWLGSNSADVFQSVFEVTDYVQIEVADQVIEEVRSMLVEMLSEALEIIRELDLGQEAVGDTVTKLLLLGNLLSAVVGVVQGIGEMTQGIGQQMGPSWDFSQLESTTEGLEKFRNGFSGVMDQIPQAEDWEALDNQMDQLQDHLSEWINALQP